MPGGGGAQATRTRRQVAEAYRASQRAGQSYTSRAAAFARSAARGAVGGLRSVVRRLFGR
jgi:hypothetical protein